MKETAIEQFEGTDCYGSAEEPSPILLPMSCQILRCLSQKIGGQSFFIKVGVHLAAEVTRMVSRKGTTTTQVASLITDLSHVQASPERLLALVH